MAEKKDGMISIWFWVGLMLLVYGLIITAAGVYYIFVPDLETATGHLNPSLWWGIVMVLVGLLFGAAGKFGKAGG